MSNYFTAKLWVQKKIWSKRNLGQNIKKKLLKWGKYDNTSWACEKQMGLRGW